MGCTSSKNGAVAEPPTAAATPAKQGTAAPAAGSPVLLDEDHGKNTDAGASAAAPADDSSTSISEERWRQRVAQVAVAGDTPPLHIRALTCNLGTIPASESSSSALTSMPDVVGFQACDDVSKVLMDQGLATKYTGIRGPHSLAMAYTTSDWERLGSGAADVAVDEAEQFKEARGVQWMRLSHRKSGKVVFFMNHHGPLRVNSGGRGGGPAIAESIVRVVFRSVQPGDAVVVVGDFNAQPGSQTLRELERFMPRVAPSKEYDGLDHVFSPQQVVGSEGLPAGTGFIVRFTM